MFKTVDVCRESRPEKKIRSEIQTHLCPLAPLKGLHTEYPGETRVKALAIEVGCLGRGGGNFHFLRKSSRFCIFLL